MHTVYFIACGFPPVGRGNAITNACVANHLADHAAVEVVCRRPRGDVLLSYQEDESLVEGLDPRLKIHRVEATGWWGLNEALYVVGLLPCYYLNWALSVWRRRRQIFSAPGVLLAVHPIFSGVLLGVWIKRATGMPLVVDFRDDFAGGLSLGWRRLLAPLYRRLERWVLERADCVTVTTPTLKEWLVRRHGLASERIEVVYNIVPETPEQEAEPEQGGDAVRIGYAGALSSVQRPEILLQAHAALCQRRPLLKTRMQVEIYGPESPYYRLKMREHFAAGAHYGGFLPRDQVEERLRACQLGYVSLSDPAYAYALPTKLIDYIQMGMPVLASLPRGAARDLIEENELGLVAEPGDAEGLSLCLERLVEDPALRRRCGRNAAALRAFFEPAAQVEKWGEICHRLASVDTLEGSGKNVRGTACR